MDQTERATVNAISLAGVSKTFVGPEGVLPTLERVDFRVREGEFVSVIGPSGCGKSTLLNIIAGLEEADGGRMEVAGVPWASRLGRVAYMPQKDSLLPWRSVLDNAALGLELRGIPRPEARARAGAHTEAFGLRGFEDAYPSALSGGMRQRAAFLRTVLTDEPIILLDEPFGALDALTRAQMQDWLLRLWDRLGKTVVLVTHDVDEAVLLSDRIYVLSPRPGSVRLEVAVPLPRPRAYDLVTTEAFQRIKAQVLSAVHGGPWSPVAAPAYPAPGPLPAPGDHTQPVAPGLVAARVGVAWRRHVSEWLPPFALVAAGIGLWEILVRALHVPRWQVPPPSLVAVELWESRALLLRHGGATFREVVFGFGAALAAGVGLALPIAYSRVLERVLYPFVIASQTIPIIALAPLLLIWVGPGLGSKVIVVALICFFPIVVNTVDGLRAVDPDAARMARTLGASRWALFTRVQIPTSLPFFFSGVKVAIAVSVIGAVVGEWVGADAGLGYLTRISVAYFETARIFAAIVVLSGMGIGLFLLATLAERVALPWYHAPRRSRQFE